MTDSETIKGLEKCCESDCDNCDITNQGLTCVYLYREVRDLIKRQQVEIDRLKERFNLQQEFIEDLEWTVSVSKAEAIKQSQQIVKSFFCECIENGIMEIDVVDANAEICKRLEMM